MLKIYLKEKREIFEKYLQEKMTELKYPERLSESMVYSVMNGGKRLRPVLMYMIADIFITLKAHMAVQEREKTISRINQGLMVAREKGKTLGRPKAELPKDFIKEYKKFKDGDYGDMSAMSFAKMLGIGRSTLYKYINIFEGQEVVG